MINLTDRHVVIIGGGMGIGLAAANLLLSQGASVFVGDRDPQSRERLPQGAGFQDTDATQPASVQGLFDSAERAMGGIDGVFTTIGGAALGSFEDLDLAAWRREIEFNLNSAFVVGKAALPFLKRGGGGSLVFTSSGYALLAGVDRAAYSASKAGLLAFSRSLASIAAPQRTRVNCIAPGPTDTPRFRAMNGGDEGVERVRAQMPLGTIPTPGDSANMAIFLLSDAAAAITGQTIHVNGGLVTP